MSRLSDLIKDLHPADVPSVSFGSLMTRIRERGKDDESVAQVYVVSNTQGIVRAEDYRENTIHSEDTSNYTVIRPGMIAYNPSRLNIGSIAMLKNDEPGLVSPMYVVFSIDQSKIEKEYCELLMKSSYVSSRIDALKEEGARFRFDYTRWEWINVPLPSKTIQQEVVNTLNVFQDLINSLTSELDARKKQYEHCRAKLLSFNKDIPRMPLAAISNSFRGDYITKKSTNSGDIPVILGGQEPAYFIDKSNHDGEIVVIARSGASAGFVSYWNEPIFVTDGFGYEAKENVTIPKYLYFILKNIEKDLNAMKRGAGVPHVSSEAIGKIELPVPSIEEQKRIVSIIESFESLCNDGRCGLPAEIEARQKQYEYYRNKLLTF